MAIIPLKAWYLDKYEPIREIIKRPHTLRLNKNSLLKSGLRVDFLDDSEDVRNSEWFGHYLAGETIEFYIEGSGNYAISNIDLVSQEIYFTKHNTSAWLEPIIFLSYQSEYQVAREALQETLHQAIAQLNKRSRLLLKLELSLRPPDAPLRLSSFQLRQIRKSLLFIADGTPIVNVTNGENAVLVPSPNVCVEIGYALQSKRQGQILLVQMERPQMKGQFPFDLTQHQHLPFKSAQDLQRTLPSLLETLLARFKLLS